MIFLQFTISAILVAFTAIQLAKYGDIIAIRSRLGRLFVGTLFMAAATSLPELLSAINAIAQNVPDISAGDLFGSSMLNMLLLAILGLIHYKERLLRKAALKHALSGGLAVFITILVIFFIMADIDIKVGWIGIDSIIIILAYLVSIRLLHSSSQHSEIHQFTEIELAGIPSLGKGILGFILAALAMVVITPFMISSAVDIAEISGLGLTFIGTALVALVTSLPELITTIAAARIGADDMAIGNLFGSNMFNMVIVGVADLFYLQGRFLSVIDNQFLLIGMLGLIMTSMGLIGNLAKFHRRFFLIEFDALMLIFIYFAGMFFLYTQVVSP